MINCSDVLAPGDEELMGLLYDEHTLSPQAQTHFERCSLCQQRLETYAALHNTLQSKLYRSLCPGGARLNYYCLGMVPEEERVSIAAHLLDCLRCTDEVAEIRRMQAGFEPFPERPSALRSILPRLFATQVRRQLSPVTRNEARATEWPRKYQAGSVDLSLHLSRQVSGEYMLLGILTSSDPEETVDAFEGISIHLYATPGPLEAGTPEIGEPLLSTHVDDVGNLVLEPVPAGEYVLLIQLPDKEVVIEGVIIERL
jgi:hypothetical protein